MKKRYTIKEEECKCSLSDFYEKAAKMTGAVITPKTKFDCRKICVTIPVQDSIRAYYFENGKSNIEISILLLQCGPKANLDGATCEFEVEAGFTLEEDE